MSIRAGRPSVGHATVIGSWRDILDNPARPHIVCAEPYAIIDGDSGRVLCIEVVNGAALAACNSFRRIDGVWRLVHHQSSPSRADRHRRQRRWINPPRSLDRCFLGSE